MERSEEAELVRRVADGDRTAFAELVRRHQRPLSLFTRRMLGDAGRADEIVQETLLRLWTRASRFDAGTARLTTWLHNIAHNLCVDSLRRGSRIEALDDRSLHGESGSDPESQERSRRRSEQVQAALATLPERQRSALLLCYYQGLSNRDAAQILAISVDALESLLARGRRRLREELEYDDEP